MKLPKWLKDVELIVDRSIPFLLVLLAVLIIVDFTHFGEAHHHIIVWIDNFIIAFFIIDLLFKWNHATNAVNFIKLYWIDIIAVFPFYLIFRLYAVATEITIAGERTQKLLHEAALLRETKLIGEGKLVGHLAKEGRLIRAAARGLRLLRFRWYVIHGHLQSISAGYRAKHKTS